MLVLAGYELFDFLGGWGVGGGGVVGGCELPFLKVGQINIGASIFPDT